MNSEPMFTCVEDCLNGYSIVEDKECHGVASSEGELIVPLAYQNIHFIKDDVIAAWNGALWLFFDTEGNVLGRVEGGKYLPSDVLLGMYLEESRNHEAKWETVVLEYEQFCEKCLSEDADPAEMKILSESLKEEAGRIGGFMNEGQRLRIRQAYDSFRQKSL